MNDETYGIILRIAVNNEFKAALFIELMRINGLNMYMLTDYNPTIH